MGTGKTKTTIDAIDYCNEDLILILCPKSVIPVWTAEFAKHGTRGAEVVELSGDTVKERAKVVRNRIAARKETGASSSTTGPRQSSPLVFVVNYEAAWRKPLGDELLKHQWDRVVLDESHRIKDPKGKASKWCEKLSPCAKVRTLLTGTPMPHSPLDIFAQYRFLDPAIFGRSFTRFRARYAVMGGYQGKEVTGFQNMEELNRLTYQCALRCRKDDVLDLPPATHITRPVELGAEARRVYNDLASTMEADVRSGEITVSNALVRLLRLQQVTGGFVKADDRPDVERIDAAKADALAEIMDELDQHEPLVVFCRFHGDIQQVLDTARGAGREAYELSGRAGQLGAFRATAKDGAVLAVQIQAGGVGIDLSFVRYCVLWSVGFSLGDYEQAIARVHRQGQTRNVTYLHLTADDTIDETIRKALDERRDLVESVLEDMKGQL
jgi:SNF2 family DNA or RNA helicase